jgi:hypothetical protein
MMLDRYIILTLSYTHNVQSGNQFQKSDKLKNNNSDTTRTDHSTTRSSRSFISEIRPFFFDLNSKPTLIKLNVPTRLYYKIYMYEYVFPE